MLRLLQGDIIKIERTKLPVLVVSRDSFNTSGAVIGCPIMDCSDDDPLHVQIIADETEGCVQCENVHLLDLEKRGFVKVGTISLEDRMEISDRIQNIFEYV